MKNLLIKSILVMLLFITACKDTDDKENTGGEQSVENSYSIKSPDGQLIVDVYIGKQLTYNVTYGGTLMLKDSPLALILGRGIIWGANPKLEKATEESVDKTIEAQFYQKREVRDSYRRLYMDFGDNFDVEFRVYDEGMAYRFVSKRAGSYQIYGEQADFSFAENAEVYVAYAPHGAVNKNDRFNTSFEEMYTQTTVNGVTASGLVMTPMLSNSGGKKLCIAESDVINYPGMFLTRSANKNNTLSGTFSFYPEQMVPQDATFYSMSYSEYIATCNGPRTFPWRIICVASNDANLLTNDMVYRLATPSRIENTSWIKPGLATWDYWSNWDGLGGSGKTFSNYKKFIDFAASKGIPYYLMDAGWGTGTLDSRPEIRLDELIAYAKDKGVGLLLWGGCAAFTGDRMEEICRRYSDMGIKGFKIDFWEHDNQRMMELMRKTAEMTAKYNLLLIYHGCTKPTGLERTYPNIVSYEAIKGMEYASTGAVGIYDMVDYNVTFPFIRQIAGPSDYTPGVMKNVPIGSLGQASKASEGTRCQQVALFITTYSPMGMLCDGPSKYEASESNKKSAEFIAKIPTVWDETIGLDAKLGEYILLARRKGNEWFVGGVNNKSERNVNVPLVFLSGGDFQMNLICDADDATIKPENYKQEKKTVTSGTSLNIKMAPGGGFAARIYK